MRLYKNIIILLSHAFHLRGLEKLPTVARSQRERNSIIGFMRSSIMSFMMVTYFLNSILIKIEISVIKMGCASKVDVLMVRLFMVS